MHIILGALIILGGFLGYLEYRLSTQIVLTQSLADSRALALDLSQKIILNRVAKLEGVSKSQIATTKTLIESQKSTLSALNQSLKNLSTQSAAATALRWRMHTVQVTCVFPGFTQTGSGTLFSSDGSGQPIVLTNLHVITDDNTGRYANSCTLNLTELADTYTVSRSALAPGPTGTDLAFIVIPNPSNLVKQNSVNSSKLCSTKASIGEQIIILGYPAFGASGSVTVTEGIISGYEKNYYLSSAKVEHGHSGGTAVLVSKDCYLGPPTFVAQGSLESLARILDVMATGLVP